MGNYSVCVYAICKNEEAFVDRWMDSMSEADRVVVLDTGSSDATVEKLRNRGAEVTVEVISPWRFDTARNRSLELVPEDADINGTCNDSPAGGSVWRRPGRPARGRPRTAIPGLSTPTARKAWCSGTRRYTSDTGIAGSTRSTRCSSGWEKERPDLW